MALSNAKRVPTDERSFFTFFFYSLLFVTGYQILPPPANGGINEPQDCPYCRRTFSCYYSLKRHFQDKHERSDTLYVCEFCRRRYRTKNSLTTHKSLQHRGSAVALKRLIKTVAIAASAVTLSSPTTIPHNIILSTPPPSPKSSSDPLSESPPPDDTAAAVGYTTSHSFWNHHRHPQQ